VNRKSRAAPDIGALERKAIEIRKQLLTMIFHAGGGHTGGSLSSVDILVALYYHVLRIRPDQPAWPDRDRFVMSKGHSVEGYYCVLADRGFFPLKVLETYGTPGTILAGHPTVKVPGVELNTGALGHGLSAGVGMALAARMDRKDFRTCVLLGDGELAEGSVWEAAMAASHFELSNLTAIVDRNRLQISGDTEEVMGLDDLSERWSAFGWQVSEVDGHDIAELVGQFDTGRSNDTHGSPRLLIARTTKGRGVSFIENQADWHHHVPTADQLERAIAELDAALGQLAGAAQRGSLSR
jgi:transketolase